jgi:hypothetical protein
MNPFEILGKIRDLQKAGIEVIFSEEINEEKITVVLKNKFPKGIYVPLKVIPQIASVLMKKEDKKD